MKRTFLSLMALLCLLVSSANAQYVTRLMAGLVQQEAIPLSATTAGNGFRDLGALKTGLLSTSIVGVGEGTHGTHEFFTMKHRLFEFLAAEMGYTIFAIEDGIYGAELINQYVLSGKGDPKQIIKDEFHGVWQVQELVDLIEWMRQYNEKHARKLIFAGFDNQQIDSYVRALRAFEEKYKTNVFNTLTAYDGEGSDSIHTAMQLALMLADSLAAVLPPKPAQVPAAAWEETCWYFSNIRAGLRQFSNKDWLGMINTRDSMMALNVERIQRLYPGQKIMLWAHNGHVGRLHPSVGKAFKTLGAHLTEYYGKEYTNIGFATGVGTYRAVDQVTDSMRTDNKLQPPVPGTIEYFLQAAHMPLFLTSTQQLPLEGHFRTIGVYASPKDQFQNRVVCLPELFDWLIYADITTAAAGL